MLDPVSSPFHELEAIIDRNPMIVTPDTPLVQVIAGMVYSRSTIGSPLLPPDLPVPSSAPHSTIVSTELTSNLAASQGGYVLVMQKSRLVGVFSTHDLIRLIAAATDLTKIKVAEVMKPPVLTLPVAKLPNLFKIFSLFGQYWTRHLPVVDEKGQLMGIVTPESVQRGLLKVLSQPPIVGPTTVFNQTPDLSQPLQAFLSRKLVYACSSTPVRQLVQLMAQHEVSCILITQAPDGSPPATDGRQDGNIPDGCWTAALSPHLVGIVCESDILNLIAQQRDLTILNAQSILHRRLVCMHYKDTLYAAYLKMSHCQTANLGVLDDSGRLIGLLSHSDLLDGLSAETAVPLNTIRESSLQQVPVLPSVQYRLEQVSHEREQLEQQLRWLTQKEAVMEEIAQLIQQGISLEVLLNRAVNSLQQFLQGDRLCVYRFLPDWNGLVVAEATAANTSSLLGFLIRNELLSGEPIRQQYERGQEQAIADIACLSLDPSTQELLAFFKIQAAVSVPLFQGSHLWGLLVIHQCQSARQWQPAEIAVLKQIANLLSIAIWQNHLRQSIQSLKTGLEIQVQEQTNRLKQALGFEATLKRITDKVRDSLDEHQILETAMQEVTNVLGVYCCQAILCDGTPERCMVCHEYFQTLVNARESMESISEIPEFEQQVHSGWCFQFCITRPFLNRGAEAILICPIFDDQGHLGHLRIFASRSHEFDQEEIQLVQQVANHCAIAIRQARLYQAAQEQVKELAYLHQMKDDFLSTVSHELRSPLATIKMIANMLEITLGQWQNQVLQEGTLAEADRINQYLVMLEAECDRELNLVDELLTIQRLSTGTHPLTLTDIELQSWAMPIIATFQERTRSQQQHLQVEIGENLPTLQSDAFMLSRILVELLNNACKYTPAGEEIQIRIRAQINTIHVMVSNSGIEINPDQIQRIFEPFYRIPHQDQWKQGGTGLGLALVQRLTHYLGGTIQADSQDGRVSFTVCLPVVPNHPASA